MTRSKEILINLLEEDKAVARRRSYLLTGIIIVIILFGSMGYTYQSAQNKLTAQQTLNTELKAKLQEYEISLGLLKDEQQFRENLLWKQKSVKEIEKLQVSYLGVFEEIEKAMPDGGLLIAVEIETGKAMLEGYSSDYNIIAQLLSGLRASPLFKNVKEISAEFKEEANEINFKIEMDWGD